MRYRLITFVVFGAVLVGIGEWTVRNDRLGALNTWWLEFCVGNTSERISDPAVTFVRIDRNYVPVFGEEFTRADYAAILGFVSRFEPRAVAFEPTLEFDESILVNQDALAPLKEAALTLPELTLATVVESGQSPQSPEEDVTYPVITRVEGDAESVPRITRTVATPDSQMLANGTPAFTAIELGGAGETGGKNRVSLIARHEEALVPGFVLQALIRHAGLTLDDVSVRLDGRNSSIAVGDRYTIPIDATGSMSLYPHSGVGRHSEDDSEQEIANRRGLFKSVSAFNLTLTGENDPEMEKLLTDLRDEFASMKANLVVIGDDHAANRHVTLADGDPPVSRAELLSRAIATVQSGRFISWWPAWARLLGAAAIFAVAIYLFRYRRLKLLAFGLIAALLYFFLVVIIFQNTLRWTPPLTQLALFGLLLVAGLILPGPPRGDAKDDREEEEPDDERPVSLSEVSAAEKRG